MVMESDHLKGKYYTEQQCKIFKQKVQEKVSDIISKCYHAVVFSGPNDLIVIILNEILEGDCTEKVSFEVVGKEIINRVKDELGLSVTIGVGGTYDEYTKIFLSFQEGLRALESKFFEENGRIIKYQCSKHARAMNNIFVFGEKNQVLICIRTKNMNELKNIITNAFNAMMEQNAPRHNVHMVAMELVSIGTEYVSANNTYLDKAVEDHKDIFEVIRTLDTMDEMKNTIMDFYKHIIGDIKKERRPETLKLVQKAKEYIEANYYKYDLSLEEIAESLVVSPTYISNIFKKEVGYSVIEYLTEYRVKKAKEIVDQCKDIQLSDVAQKVGYNDPYYFSKCFKKYYGLSFSKYIENKI
jgi:two-component system response regulator YesN